MDPVSVGIWGVQFLLHNHSALYLARLEIKEHLTEGEMLNVKKKNDIESLQHFNHLVAKKNKTVQCGNQFPPLWQ